MLLPEALVNVRVCDAERAQHRGLGQAVGQQRHAVVIVGIPAHRMWREVQWLMWGKGGKGAI